MGNICFCCLPSKNEKEQKEFLIKKHITEIIQQEFLILEDHIVDRINNGFLTVPIEN